MYYDPIGNLLGTWAMGDGLWTIALRLLLALLFGAVLGCERAAKRHAAGLRTFVLVCLSGTAAMTLDRAIGSLPVISGSGRSRHRDHQHKLDSVQFQKPDPRSDNGDRALVVQPAGTGARRGALYAGAAGFCGNSGVPFMAARI